MRRPQRSSGDVPQHHEAVQHPARLASRASSEHGYRGVTFDHDNNSWRARLYCAGRHITLGRYATAKLAAKSHDLAAYYVRGEGAVTNFGVAEAREAWQTHPQTYSPVLRRSLQAAIARLQAIGVAGGAKAGTQQWHPYARSGFAGSPIGPIDAQAVAARIVAATMAGAGPSPDLMRELFQAVSFGFPNRRRVSSSKSSSSELHRITSITQVLVLAAMRAPM